MCALLHLLICTALRAHIIVVEALCKINYHYYDDIYNMYDGLLWEQTNRDVNVERVIVSCRFRFQTGFVLISF